MMGASREYHKAWRDKRREQGICQLCPRPSKIKKDGTPALYCQECSEKKVALKAARYVRKRVRFTRPSPLWFKPGRTTCLRCDQTFDSPDVRDVRICDKCRPSYQAIDIDYDWAALCI